jgi:hypothetical protein
MAGADTRPISVESDAAHDTEVLGQRLRARAERRYRRRRTMPGHAFAEMSKPRTTSGGWFLFLSLVVSCATAADRPPERSSRPVCAQPFAEGKCLEGTWPASWRDGRWDCRIIQDELALDGIPADRCASFVGPDEVADRIRRTNASRGTVQGP